MTQLRVELHQKTGGKGTFLMGNIKFPGTLELDDLVVFVYHKDDGRKADLYIEPRRDKPNKTKLLEESTGTDSDAT